jgi:hypothetical protein
MTVKTMDLTAMGRDELDEVYRASPAGPIPVGPGRGTALLFPGSAADGALRPLIRALFWKGKTFRPQSQDLKNRIGPLGTLGIRAKVYEDESWFSPGPAIVLDYSRTSPVARMIRDEIRQVAPGVYLGQIFAWKKRVGLFMLEFPT